MQLARIVVSIGAALVVSASAHAQCFDPMAPQELLLWPSAFGTPSFTRTACGQLTGDGVRDAVTLSGTQLVVLWNVAYYDKQIALPQQANDFDIAANTGTLALATDGVAVVNSSGLELITLTSSPTEFTASPIEAGDWVGAHKVRCANIDASGGTDYVGISDDDHHVLMHLDGVPSPEPITLVRAAFALELGQWDLDTQLEIFLLTTGGLEVYEQDGTQVAYFANSGVNGGLLTMLRGSRDRAAVIFPTTDGRYSLKICRIGPVVEGPISLPETVVPVGLTCGDFDGDGDLDLVVSHLLHQAPMLRVNNPQGPSDWFSTQSSWTYVDDYMLQHSWAGDNAATPLCADLNADGLADLLIATHQTSATPGDAPAHVYLEAHPCLTPPGPEQSPPPPPPPYFTQGYITKLSSGERWTFLYALLNNNMPSPANAFVVVQWRQPYAGAWLEESTNDYTLNNVPSNLFPGGSASVGLKLDIHDTADCFADSSSNNALYWFDVAPVQVDTNGVIVNDSFTHHICAISCSEEDVCEYLCALNDDPYTMLNHVPPSGPMHDSQTNVLERMPACANYLSCRPGNGTTPLPVLVNRRRLPGHQPGVYPTYANSPPDDGELVFAYQ